MTLESYWLQNFPYYNSLGVNYDRNNVYKFDHSTSIKLWRNWPKIQKTIQSKLQFNALVRYSTKINLFKWILDHQTSLWKGLKHSNFYLVRADNGKFDATTKSVVHICSYITNIIIKTLFYSLWRLPVSQFIIDYHCWLLWPIL